MNKLKAKYEKLLKDDPFMDLTTTYEYETDYSKPKTPIVKLNGKNEDKSNGQELEKSKIVDTVSV
ncbi:MAG: hypothetical protein COB01_11705 [Lutibacter sp.]|nr:MAG: hypothetical protein COB01_11705 [Lutibacter sp.]